MNFLKRETRWSSLELGIFKLAVFTAGILFCFYLRNYFASYITFIWFISVITCIMAMYLWVKKIRQKV